MRVSHRLLHRRSACGRRGGLSAECRGLRIALFYTKVHDRLLTPLCTAAQPPAPIELRDALRTIDTQVNSYIDRARLGKAA